MLLLIASFLWTLSVVSVACCCLLWLIASFLLTLSVAGCEFSLEFVLLLGFVLLLIAGFLVTRCCKVFFVVYEIHCQIHAELMQWVQELTPVLCLIAREVFKTLRYCMYVFVLAWQAD
jgi:hypothetical protein